MKKITSILFGLILMGNVNVLWGDILDHSKTTGDYTVHIVSTVTKNCNLPFTVIANGCTFWNTDGTVKRIEVRQKTVNPKNQLQNTEEFVLYHELGHATVCKWDERCADEYAKKMVNTLTIAK